MLMKRRIAVLACGWCTYFLKDFILGMQRAVQGKNIDLYVFNTYNYTEYSGYPNYTGASIFNLILSKSLEAEFGSIAKVT